MRQTRRIRTMIGAALIVAGIAMGCSKSDNKTTNPGTPGAELGSPNISSGTLFVHAFATAGAFPYHCSIHTVMHGSVSVAAGADSDTIHVRIVNASSTGFQPASVTVKPGGVVIWSNVSGLTHTVTSD